MRRIRLIRLFTSVRTALGLLCVLSLMLLLGVVLPQEAVVGEEHFSALVRETRVARFILVDLGLGRLATSPVFLFVLGLFFANLLAVLLSRLGPTWQRTRPKVRSESGLQAWTRTKDSLVGRLHDGWSVGHVVDVLMSFGYQVRRAGKQTVWGVRHRTAPLGFLLFHFSFLLLCAGGVLLYYTRFVGAVAVAERQTFTGQYQRILRQPPFGGPPSMQFTVVDIDPQMERGQHLHLGATLLFRRGAGGVARRARINRPARWGPAAILVQQAGLSPLLWLQDARGFTLDRVAVNLPNGDEGSMVPMADGRFLVYIEPRSGEETFPSRSELSSTALRMLITGAEGGQIHFEGTLRPGETAELGEAGRLVLSELRYWIGLQVVSERGGALLILGFLLGVLGLVWRLLWFRREIAVGWDDAEFRVVGQSEYYVLRFREELAEVFAALQEPGTTAAAKPAEEPLTRETG